MNMRTVLLSLLLSGFTPFVHASLIHDLSSDLGNGQIEFATESGSDVTGVVAFSFTAGPLLGQTTTFGKGDISNLSWSIDSNWELTLDLLTNFVSSAPGPATGCLALNVGPGSVSTQACGDGSGDGTDGVLFYFVRLGTGASEGIPEELFAAAVHPAPEPATVLLMCLGLAGIGWSRKKAAL